MANHGLNHINLSLPADRLEEIRDFYVDIVGLREGPRPDFDFPGYWLYAGDFPVVHMMHRPSEGTGPGTSYLDHVAFTCTDLDATEQKLERQGISYRKREIAAFNIVQLFFHDPTGLGIEMNFLTEN